LAKTVAKIETQSDSTTAVGQTRGVDGDDIFAFSMENEIATPDTNSTHMECLQYLQDKTYSLEVLHEFPSVKTMFVKYNTAIPSSAPVECLFSYAGIVLLLTKNAVA